MRVVIVEDEIPAQRLLKKYILELFPDTEITAILGSVTEAVKWFEENRDPDVLFLDVQLGDGVGFNILERVKIKSFIVFTTAFDQYAIKAFKANAIDYILKPIKVVDLKRVFDQMEQKRALFQPSSDSPINLSPTTPTEAIRTLRNYFLISKNNGWYTLAVKNVAYFFIEDHWSCARTFDGEKHLISESLGNIMEGLDPLVFNRVNRQFILNIASVDKVENWFGGKLVVITKPKHDEHITVGREKSVEFRDWLNQ
ncbi:LytTR family DNA-binding domain-containing protein [Halosquirtibacter xylanolyticus]|uniref:LytR/AlgR family response regulator transcription factor n=1 Tax=Halosquirtibacter xylanolyticus TaxID=3374599 RepID=UPI0037482EE3|nr:LytTR family DNA-binding domain-containing protein [Prolixibacteraceae bacterium]